MTILLGLIWWGSASARLVYRIHQDNRAQDTAGLPLLSFPGSAERILFFAPHCDDETLAAGGLLYESARSGARIRVVVVTNGDGFRFAAEREFQELNLTPDDYIRFAHQRQEETRAAMKVMGIQPEDVLFLGYPDRGLAAMWNDHWEPSHPYRSPFTRCRSSPYRDSWHPGAPYAGRTLRDDIATLVREFRPTQIYFPHPNDDHPDHWATSCFVRAALLAVENASAIKTRSYLVHRGDWPVPQGLHPRESLPPPAGLANLDTQWYYLPLSQEAIVAKYRALQRYESQMSVMRRFLLSFVRSGELFGTMRPVDIPRIVDSKIVLKGDPSAWNGLPAVILDPVQDNLVRGWEGSADIQRVFAAWDRDFLYLRADMRRSLSKRVEYRFRLRSFRGGRIADTVIRVRPDKGTVPPGVRFAWRLHLLELAIPHTWIQAPESLFIEVDTAAFGKLPIDRTAWKSLSAEPEAIACTP